MVHMKLKGNLCQGKAKPINGTPDRSMNLIARSCKASQSLPWSLIESRYVS